MITMEFEEMKKIWDTQNDQPLYAINEETLYNRVLTKKKQAGHITNFSELLGIIVNIAAGSVVLGINLSKQNANIFMYLLSAWMFITAIYLLVSRIRRTKSERRFDRSLYGDLNHAIAIAAYQVRFSRLMRWNMLPVAIFILFGIWDSGKPVWITIAIVIFWVLAYYASGWEHNIYKARKRELEMLQKKLQQEERDDSFLPGNIS